MEVKFSPITSIILLTIVSVATPARAALVDNGDGTVTDTDTGLMWLRVAPPAEGAAEFKNWRDAMLWADALEFAGYSDWRLPSSLHFADGVPDLGLNSQMNEWGDLYGIDWDGPDDAESFGPFNYPNGLYWSSTEHPGDSSEAVTFFVTYDGLFWNEFSPRSGTTWYTAVRGERVAQKAPECSDTYDNDGNLLADYPSDEGCSNAEDDWEFSCYGFIGLITCKARKADYRWLCFQIEDSTFCLQTIVIAIGFIALPSWLLWRRKQRDR